MRYWIQTDDEVRFWASGLRSNFASFAGACPPQFSSALYAISLFGELVDMADLACVEPTYSRTVVAELVSRRWAKLYRNPRGRAELRTCWPFRALCRELGREHLGAAGCHRLEDKVSDRLVDLAATGGSIVVLVRLPALDWGLLHSLRRAQEVADGEENAHVAQLVRLALLHEDMLKDVGKPVVRAQLFEEVAQQCLQRLHRELAWKAPEDDWCAVVCEKRTEALLALARDHLLARGAVAVATLDQTVLGQADQTRAAEAAVMFRKLCALYKRLAKACTPELSPSWSIYWRKYVSFMHNNWGQALKHTGEYAEGHRHLRKCLEGLLVIQQEQRVCGEKVLCCAHSYDNLGELELLMAKREGKQSTEEMLEQLEATLAKAREERTQSRQALSLQRGAHTDTALGRCYLQLGDLARAQLSFKLARNVRIQLLGCENPLSLYSSTLYLRTHC
jgi:hypothetical protein